MTQWVFRLDEQDLKRFRSLAAIYQMAMAGPGRLGNMQHAKKIEEFWAFQMEIIEHYNLNTDTLMYFDPVTGSVYEVEEIGDL